MTDLKLNPDSFFSFDLAAGTLSYGGKQGDGALIMPQEALRSFFAEMADVPGPGVARTFGVSVGTHLGRLLGSMYEGKGMDADLPPGEFLANLNGVLALHGLGLLSMETWGEVLFFEWERPADRELAGAQLQEGILCGILRAFSGRSFEVFAVGTWDGRGIRFIAGNPAMVKGVQQWMAEGASLGEITSRLMKESRAASGGPR